VPLIFALQKLSMVSGSTGMKGKMPLVTGLGEQFAWTNMMFSFRSFGNGNRTNGTGSNSSSNSSNISNSSNSSSATVARRLYEWGIDTLIDRHQSLGRGAKGMCDAPLQSTSSPPSLSHPLSSPPPAPPSPPPLPKACVRC
jgi:hypothetical protein